MPFYKYRTDQNNTIIAVSDNSFTLGPNEAQVNSATLIPAIQPPYLYRVTGGTAVVPNIDTNINTYLTSTGTDTSIPLSTNSFTGYTATTLVNNYLPRSRFNLYTGTTEPLLYQSKSSIVTLTGTTLPNTYQSKSSIVTLTGTTLPATYVNKTAYNAFTANTVSNANNGLTESPNQTVRLGGALTGATTITSPATGSRLSFAGFPIQYATDLSGNYNIRSIVDRGYVTGITSTLVSSANNGLTKSGQNVRLGGTLTGATTITSPATGSRLTFGAFPVQYGADYSANYTPRSVTDKGFVTGYTQVYKYNVGAAPTFSTATKIFVASATTDSSGVATFQVTTNGISTGTAIFTRAYSITATAANNTSSTSVIPLASIKDFSTLKTLKINVEQSNTVLLGGQGLTFSPAGILVYVTIIGI